MAVNFKEKLYEITNVLIVIIVDALLVLSVALVTLLVKICIEHCYSKKIEEIDNVAVYSVYIVSEFVLIISFAIYAILDIIIQLKAMLKKIKE